MTNNRPLSVAETAAQQWSTFRNPPDSTLSSRHENATPSRAKKIPVQPLRLISTLPPDILEVIFDICMSMSYAENERGNRLAFSQVCRQWRSIALDYHRLWRTIDVTQPELAREFLVRSGTGPLHITSSSDAPQIRLRGEDLKSHASRITSFDISFRSHLGLVTLFDNLGSNLTALTSMSLKHVRSPDTEHVHIDVSIPANVRKLELHGVAIPWSRACIGNLTNLSLLGTGRLSPSISQLHTILRSSPHLQYLSLRHIQPSYLNLPALGASQTIHPQVDRVNLPCLDELILSSTGRAVYEILSIAGLPSTCRIHITSFTNDGFTPLLPLTRSISDSSEVHTFRLDANSIQLLRSSATPWSTEPADTRKSFKAWRGPKHFFFDYRRSSLNCSWFTTLELGKDVLQRIATSLLVDFLRELTSLETLRISPTAHLANLMRALSTTSYPSSRGMVHDRLVCPHLRTITFGRQGSAFLWVIDGQGAESIVALAHARHRVSSPLSTLKFTHSRIYSNVIARLKSFAAEVHAEVYAGRGGTWPHPD
ncbi:hypothetical protein LshimejAT787_0211700 [Lyophyllum shimeji]|uniref:F-box domain-containing protein n=1 Tax=Lyophyllum shimeji TaxID=47721 RepID=A0A9P3ULG2_LYOSH|nr:hypothetical protein LshimejAT787_0211700 [Lyophyllum shimeji]